MNTGLIAYFVVMLNTNADHILVSYNPKILKNTQISYQYSNLQVTEKYNTCYLFDPHNVQWGRFGDQKLPSPPSLYIKEIETKKSLISCVVHVIITGL